MFGAEIEILSERKRSIKEYIAAIVAGKNQ